MTRANSLLATLYFINFKTRKSIFFAFFNFHLNHATSVFVQNRSATAIQRRDKLYKKFKHSDLETDKDDFKVTKIPLQKMILKKRNLNLKKN